MRESVENYRHAEYLALVAIGAEREKVEVLRERVSILEQALRKIAEFERNNPHYHYLGCAAAMASIAREAQDAGPDPPGEAPA